MRYIQNQDNDAYCPFFAKINKTNASNLMEIKIATESLCLKNGVYVITKNTIQLALH